MNNTQITVPTAPPLALPSNDNLQPTPTPSMIGVWLVLGILGSLPPILQRLTPLIRVLKEKPKIRVLKGKPKIRVLKGKPKIRVLKGKPKIRVLKGKPKTHDKE